MARKPEPFVTLGWSAVSWIEHYLVHGPGDVQGQPIELDDEFAEFILKAYRLDPATGARRIRRAFLSRAKGRSKSGLAAFIECFESLGPCRFDHWAEPGEVSAWGYEYEPGEPVGAPLGYVEVLNVATEEGQAGNTYDAVYYMLSPETCSEALAEDYGRLDVGLTRISLPDSRGYIEPVSSGDSSKDGGKSTFIVADETHLWLLPKAKRLHGIMTRNLLKRKVASGWMLETSTMYGTGEESVAEGTHLYAMSARPGTRAAESLLFDHRQASDSWNLRDRPQRMKALRESYGPASEWMDLDALADSWDDPQVTEAEFRRYWLNQPVPMLAERITIMPKWPDCAEADRVIGGRAFLALATSFDRSWSSIGAARLDGDAMLVKPLAHHGGTDWVVETCRQLQAKFDGAPIFLDERGPAATFKPALEKAGVRFEGLNSNDVCDAAALIYDRVEASTLVHFNHPELNAAVEGATWRNVNDRRAFARRSGDISPLEAVSLAALAAERKLGIVAPPPAPRRIRSTKPARGSMATAGF